MVHKDWIKRYNNQPSRHRGVVIQSWDTAIKVGLTNDWSVCTTWIVINGCYYLVDVFRARLDHPSLVAKVQALAARDNPTEILIEDAGAGTALIQDLRSKGRWATGILPEKDKRTRMAIQTSKFEQGRVFLPEGAPWLAEYEKELFSFPQSRHDDQVDSTSQALAWNRMNMWTKEALY